MAGSTTFQTGSVVTNFRKTLALVQSKGTKTNIWTIHTAWHAEKLVRYWGVYH